MVPVERWGAAAATVRPPSAFALLGTGARGMREQAAYTLTLHVL